MIVIEFLNFFLSVFQLLDAHFGHYMDGNFIEREKYLNDLKQKFDAPCSCEACRKGWTQIRDGPLPRLVSKTKFAPIYFSCLI